MPNSKPGAGKKDIRAAYSAVVDYHNGLVQTRFTVAGLFFAANGFLALGVFQQSVPALLRVILSALGVGLAVICLLLELRTYQLVENLGARGLDLEKGLGLRKRQGFFSLLTANQQLRPKWLLTKRRMPETKTVQRVVSHTIAFDALYIAIGIVWLFLFLYWLYPLIFHGRPTFPI